MGLSTPDVFGAMENKTNPPMALPHGVDKFDITSVVDMLTPLRNDLEKPAVKLVPQIGDVLGNYQKSTRLQVGANVGFWCDMFWDI